MGKTNNNASQAFLRGGNWNNTSNAGVFALNLNNAPSNQNNNIGFRCASDSNYLVWYPQGKRQNEWYLFTDRYPGFKDHSGFFHPVK